ncbi:MAG: response regulator transcription factor [Propionibacterium sp.]|nr:response regulator transcription factor [Propionibacterium sp.]
MKPRVLIVDDEELIRSGLAALLQHRGVDVIGTAGDGRTGVTLTRELGPDVVLMDLRMPRWDGLRAIREIVQLGLDVRVLVLTAFDLDDDVRDALAAGASGYICKTVTPDRLAEAIHDVAAGHRVVDARLTERLIDNYLSSPGQRRTAAALADLTAREVEVLRLVAGGYTNTEIAADLVVSEATVKTHVNRLMRKLAVSTRVHLTVAAYECGLVRPGAGSSGVD